MFLLPLLIAVACAASSAAAPQKTVMAWIEGNFSDVSDFVLRGEGKGAVNAVSHTSLFRLHANSTSATLAVDAVALAEHRRMWQQGTAKQLGIRTYPCVGYGGNISGLRTLFQPTIQGRVIEELVAAVHSADVDVR